MSLASADAWHLLDYLLEIIINLTCFQCEDPLSAVYSVWSTYMFIREPYLQKAQNKSQTPMM